MVSSDMESFVDLAWDLIDVRQIAASVKVPGLCDELLEVS